MVCCANSGGLQDTIGSVRAQTFSRVEIIQADCAGGRNAGFQAAQGSYVVILPCGSLLRPAFVARCLEVLARHADAAFVYTDSCRTGAKPEYSEEFNLYELLDRNIVPEVTLIRKEDWTAAGGFDERLEPPLLEWDFWLRLGSRQRFGRRLNRPLFERRERAVQPGDAAKRKFHEAIALRYPDEARARIKAKWAPAVCAMGPIPGAGPSIEDWESVPLAAPWRMLARSRAAAFWMPGEAAADAHCLEWAALAVWSGYEAARLPDGSLAFSRRALAHCKALHRLPVSELPATGKSTPSGTARRWPGPLEQARRHLANAELLDARAWLKHPLQSVLRLIPLGLKSRVNEIVGRPVFDLSFYAQFQTEAFLREDHLVTPLRYFPKARSERRRIAFVTPHLDPGGAELVLLEIAAALGREQYEMLLIATEPGGVRWKSLWQQRVDHVYDLGRLVAPNTMATAACSILRNWEAECILMQNSVPVYRAAPRLRDLLPRSVIMDLIHSVAEVRGRGSKTDHIESTLGETQDLDLRLAISTVVQKRLQELGVSDNKIRVMRNGIDLDRFSAVPPRASPGPRHILFAGRLDANKRPLLLVDIALELCGRHRDRDFRMLVAGDGPEEERLREAVRLAGLERMFVFFGQALDVRPLLKDADLLILLSSNEGIPMVVLEALAMGRPVVASDVGAVREVVDGSNGVLIKTGDGEVARFASAVLGLLDDVDLRREMGLRGRRKIEDQYDRRRFQREYRELFEESLRSR